MIIFAVQLMCVFIPFDLMVEIMNLFYCFVIVLLCLSFFLLRRKNYVKDVPEMFRAATNPFIVFLLGVSPIVISLFLVVVSVFKSFIPLLSSAGFTLLLILFYLIRSLYNRKKNERNSDKEEGQVK